MTAAMHQSEFLALGLAILCAIGMAIFFVLVPIIFGARRTHGAVKDSPYECGLPTLQEGQPRFSVKFYVLAMLFIVFDLEGIFLLGWAAVYRDLIQPATAGGVGWSVFWVAIVFLLILEVGHIYAWRKGALDWAPRRREARPGVGAP